jgi:RNA polymerase sigma-70 factor (ECF subfamily)
MDFGPAGDVDAPLAPPMPEVAWLQPIPDGQVLAPDGDPAEVIAARETIRLAFVAALQHLPPRQRAVLILREVLRWRADEVAELLETSVASVNSALQRARATLATANGPVTGEQLSPMDGEQEALLARYVDAFQRYDVDSLTTLLHEDATQSMPPYALWLQGRDDVLTFWLGPGAACRGSRLVPVVANGAPAFGQYKPSGPGGRHEPWSLQVLDIVDGKVVNMTFFLDTSVFPAFGLPPSLD